jgi:hypothetical protein
VPVSTPTTPTTPVTTNPTGTTAGTSPSTGTPQAATAVGGTVSAATPMNIGGGGCTASENGNDISMFLLLIGCAIVGYRRRIQQMIQH